MAKNRDNGRRTDDTSRGTQTTTGRTDTTKTGMSREDAGRMGGEASRGDRGGMSPRGDDTDRSS